MDAAELLKTWPAWAKAGTETILASPAWRLPVRLGDARGVMTAGPADAPRFAEEAIRLTVAFDGEETVLALADSPLWPDLHRLWTLRAKLPPAVLLALVERECGDLFTLLEDLTRKGFSIAGLADASDALPAGARACTVALGEESLAFALAFDAETRQRFARLENLDPAHPSIRSLTRPAHPDYTAFLLTGEERAALKPGDLLLLPENFPAARTWSVEPPPEGALRLVSARTADIPFGAFADDALPPVPEPEALVLVSGATELFACDLTRVGDAPAVRLNPLT